MPNRVGNLARLLLNPASLKNHYDSKASKPSSNNIMMLFRIFILVHALLRLQKRRNCLNPLAFHVRIASFLATSIS